MKAIFSAIVMAGLCLGCKPKSLESEISGNGFAVYDPQQIETLIESQKIDLKTRVSEIESLQTSFKNSYVGYNLKKSLIDLSGDEIFQDCIQQEKAFADKSYHHDFYERLLQCLARFQDGHLSIKKMTRSLYVISPITNSVWMNGKWIISSIRPQIIEKLVTSGLLTEREMAGLIPGAQILEVNGVSAEQELQTIEKTISGSSPLGRRFEAVGTYFFRNFYYPSEPTVTLKILTPTQEVMTLKIPWFSYVPSSSPDFLETPHILKKRGILSKVDFDSSASLWKSSGFSSNQTVFAGLDEKRTFQYLGDDVLILGVAKTPKQKVCYLQALSFDIERDNSGKFWIEEIENSNSQVDYLDVVEAFLVSCESNGNKLILDLRNNGGGDSLLADKLASLFDSPTQKPIFRAKALNAKPGNFPIVQNVNVSTQETRFLEEIYANAWLTAVQNNDDVTPWILEKSGSYKTNVFNQSVTILTGPFCFSACEQAVARFKLAERAQIVGQATHGTGFGFFSTELAATNWRSSFNEFEVSIPNQAFQMIFADARIGSEGSEQGQLIPFCQVPVLENHPTQPDIAYELQQIDLKDLAGYSEFLTKFVDELN